jgi:ketosteroid isomerase-like protein
MSFRSSPAMCLLALTAGLLTTGCSRPAVPVESKDATTNKANDEAGLRAANDQFYFALNAMFTGDLAPMDAVWSHQNDVTNLGPFGDRLVGWDAVGAQFKKEAGMKLGGRVVCQNLIAHAGKDLGYAVCTEHGENMSAAGTPVSVSHRATNIFRLENSQWKLIHHHTDLSPQLQQAAGAARK